MWRELPYNTPQVKATVEVSDAVPQLLANLSAVRWAGLGCAVVLIALGLYLWTKFRGDRVMLLDFCCFDPPERLWVSTDDMIAMAHKMGTFKVESLNFIDRVIAASGLGPVTAYSDGILDAMREVPDPLRVNYKGRLEETEMVLFSTVDELLASTGIKPHEIDIVITACDAFAPTPSMAAMLVNRYKLKQEVLTYSMGGLGCANSGVCVDMAKHLLKARSNTLCLVISHENLSAGGYIGNERSMLMPLCLFRVSGAAAFLSNRPCDARAAKYDLVDTQRTHYGQDDDAHTCIKDHEDALGLPGTRITRAVVPSAGKALRINLTALGPRVLPFSELARCLLKKGYEPDFKRAFEHFTIQTGGRAVLDAVETALKLQPDHMQPSRASLHRFGNTAGASGWYTLATMESQGSVRKGDRILALLFGGGFKAVSVVWRARRSVKEVHSCWARKVPGSN